MPQLVVIGKYYKITKYYKMQSWTKFNFKFFIYLDSHKKKKKKFFIYQNINVIKMLIIDRPI